MINKGSSYSAQITQDPTHPESGIHAVVCVCVPKIEESRLLLDQLFCCSDRILNHAPHSRPDGSGFVSVEP